MKNIEGGFSSPCLPLSGYDPACVYILRKHRLSLPAYVLSACLPFKTTKLFRFHHKISFVFKIKLSAWAWLFVNDFSSIYKLRFKKEPLKNLRLADLKIVVRNLSLKKLVSKIILKFDLLN